MTIGESLKRFRSEFKLKQEDVAAVLGLTRQAYYFYETDKAIPPAQKIVELSTTYGVSADYLLGLTDEAHPKKYGDDEVKEAFALRDALRAILTNVK